MGTRKRISGILSIGLALQFVILTAALAQNTDRDTELLTRYYSKATMFQNNRYYDSAIIYYNKAAIIYDQYKHWQGMLQCATQIATCYQAQGRYSWAAAILGPILEYSLNYTEENDTIIAQAYFMLGVQYFHQSIFDSTLIYWTKGLNIRKQVTGEQNYNVAALYYNIGLAYYLNVEFDKALESHNNSLQIRIEILGEKHPDVANSYDNIGNVYYMKTKYSKALEYYMKGLQIKTELFGVKNPDVAKSYNNIGNVYFDKSEYDKALEYMLHSLQIRAELLGDRHPDVAASFNNIGNVYYKKSEYDKALEYHNKSLEIRTEILGEKHPDVALSYNNIGLVYNGKSEYGRALDYHLMSLEIRQEKFGEKHPDVAASYTNIGIVYDMISEYDKALEYFIKGLEIRTELFGENHADVSKSYLNIGTVYYLRSDYDKALEYYLKSLQINLELFGEKHTDVADSYLSMGNVYYENAEYDKALEYFAKGLRIKMDLLGDNHPDIAMSYNNIGNVYFEKAEYDMALEYHTKSLQIREEVLGETHADVAQSYNNIGNVYDIKSEYDKALEYHNKSLQIRIDLFGEEHTDVAASYSNIGTVYKEKSVYYKSLEYYFKSLQISLDILGEKHNTVTGTYNNIGNVYDNKSEFVKALEYYQLGVSANLSAPGINKDITEVPEIRNYISYRYLLLCLHSKAQIFANTSKSLEDMKSMTTRLRQEVALLHYRACDTLITRARQEITGKSDKLALGKKANEIYTEAMQVCYELSAICGSDSVSYFIHQAFQFSEKNKASVLLESLAGSEAMKFAGIPDKLLQYEHDLNIDIALYKKLLAEGPDDTGEIKFSNKLFIANRAYDSLLTEFELHYPRYHELKYGQNQVTVKQLQKTLDKNTCIISYQKSDSSLTAFLVTRREFKVAQIEKLANYEEMIKRFRSRLAVYSRTSTDAYLNTGYELYKQLFFLELSEDITRLVIIPDGEMALIPFEALITESYRGYNYPDFPYLIKQYNISYSYSAELYYRTLPKQETDEIDVTQLYDWLAMAPVFDDEESAGTTLRTREILNEIDGFASDSTSTRGSFLTGQFITPLPGTREETETIFRQFEQQNRKATVQLYQNASEVFVKSGELEKYKYIHIASHGIVNTLKPELSGIILALDTTSGEDGILHTGEIYNLKLNADLTVLSACETGLGAIQEGEGLIGLSRALLYAGSKNIIVSLWKVADMSTSELMVDFYSNLLSEEDESEGFSEALRLAKLKMISEAKFAHPFFWSPFILIGK